MVNHVTTINFLSIDKPEDVSIKPDGILENNKKVKKVKNSGLNLEEALKGKKLLHTCILIFFYIFISNWFIFSSYNFKSILWNGE